MKKHYETPVEDTDKLISVAGPVLDYKSWYERYRKLMEEQAQRKYGLYTPTSEGDDDFPSIPGMIARYSALGLTNEQMAENPIWKDLTGNGHDLQMKNFAWSEMSGVNGYKFNFLLNEWVINNNQVSEKYSYKIVINNKENSVQLYNRTNLGHIKITLKITGIEINKSTFRVYDNAGTEHAQDYTKDGIYEIDYTSNEGANIIYFYVFGGNMGQLENPITIEQLPLYPGFIIGDGVDDYAVTEKNLDFEDTYTVYTAFIPFQEDPARNMVLFGKNYLRDIDFRFTSYVTFYSANSYAVRTLSNGFNIFVCKRTGNKLFLKNMITGKSMEADAKVLIDNPGLYYLWRSETASYAKAAIAGQVICNGHFTTDEEDTKVLNWYKKEYPWLFFDQAWTVVGKSNEDTDRATIANITGNGNNLVLSNFGFAGNSGYGEYAYNWNEWGLSKGVATNVSKQYNKFVAVMPANQSVSACSLYSSEVSIGTRFQFKLKITGLTTNWVVRVMERYMEGSNIIYEFDKDGTYQIDHTMTGSGNQLRLYIRIYCDVPNAEGSTVAVEQIPEYAGYLVTDGVDDIIKSSAFTVGKDWTTVGEWEFLKEDAIKIVGIAKFNSFRFYNYSFIGRMNVYINSDLGTNVIGESVKAATSKGSVYLDFNSVTEVTPGDAVDLGQSLFIGYNVNNFTKLAFKNLAIYSAVLSKEDMIKAYIYLQTLKAK